MSVIERDITTEEANTFVRSVAHRLEMYSIAEQIHFAKVPLPINARKIFQSVVFILREPLLS